MSVVTLVSGGLDSTIMAAITAESGVIQYPLFIDYGQKAAKLEWSACKSILKELDLPAPMMLNVSGFGRLVPSGLTHDDLDVFMDAFLPGRNMLFLVAGSSFAYSVGSPAVSIGLLSEESAIFPDQTSAFLEAAQQAISHSLGVPMKIVAPLMHLTKAEVIAIARRKGISGTYSCHTGNQDPCGECVSCREYLDISE